MSTGLDFSSLSVGEAQRACVPALKEAEIENAVMEARLLVGFAIGGGAEKVLSARDEILSAEQASTLADALKQRINRVPMSHILGRREFWSLDFKVTAATLTPRPDTETIVEAALDHASQAPARVLDLGVGTGCILLALLSEWKSAQGVGVDASADAIDVARENAQNLGLSDRARFVQTDWNLAGWDKELGGPFDVVVSNPPYIPEADIAGLERDVRDFDPMSALVGGADGLDAYHTIVAGLDKVLADQGLVVFEVGIGQAEQVAALLAEAGFKVLEQRADLGGIARAVVGRKTA